MTKNNLLFNLSDNIIKYDVLKFLNKKSLNNLLLSSKYTCGIFQKTLLNIKFNLLLKYIITGNNVEASKVLNTNPGFLLQKGNVKEPLYQKINVVTPVQLACITEDINMIDMVFTHQQKLTNKTKDQNDNLTPNLKKITAY
ncbi:hypothetical protein N9L02_01015 [Gammaproteobacteria bacterium]|nr:hypothetical protein [Gammaproteobacteria bacterium]